MTRPSVLALLLLAAISSPLRAVPIRFLPWDDAVATRKLALGSGKTVTPLKELHPFKRSAPLPGTVGEIPLRLVALDRKGTDGKEFAVDLKVGKELKSPLVLILADPANPAGLRTFVIEDDASNFPWGSVRFVNATGKALMVRQENAVTALPASWDPVDVSAGGATRNVGVMLAARDNPKVVLYSSVWEHDPQIRKLAFIVPGAANSGGGVDFKIIPEDRRVVAAEAAAATP